MADALSFGQEFLAAPQALLGFPSFGSFAALARCTMHRAHDPRQPLLEDVVGRADLQRIDRDLLAQRAGDEDEREFGPPFQGDLQGREPVERRQGQIRQHQVEILIERRHEVIPRFHPGDVADDAPVLEHGLDDFRVVPVVLEVEYSQG